MNKLERKNVIVLGMFDYNLESLNDSVRKMAMGFVENGFRVIYINPKRKAIGAMHTVRSVHNWQIIKLEEAIYLLNPPLDFIPSKIDIFKIRKYVIKNSINNVLKGILGDTWEEETIIYQSNWIGDKDLSPLYLNCNNIIFDMLDDIMSFPQISDSDKQYLETFQKKMFCKSKAIFAVSDGIANKYKLNHRKINVLRNGVDYERFNLPIENSIKEKGILTIGFIGGISSWIDLDLLLEIAKNVESVEIKLIGPKFSNEINQDDFERLVSCSNVYWSGAIPYEEVPKKLSEMDILLLPRTLEEHSMLSDPLKLYEYLAIGKPIISTAIPSALKLEPYVYIIRDSIDVAKVISKLREEKEIGDYAKKRKEIAKEYSWKARCVNMIKTLEEYKGGRE